MYLKLDLIDLILNHITDIFRTEEGRGQVQARRSDLCQRIAIEIYLMMLDVFHCNGNMKMWACISDHLDIWEKVLLQLEERMQEHDGDRDANAHQDGEVQENHVGF